ncbi:hypothetical protein GINT2_001285 [Glugoides intestinalis]
MLSQSEQEIIQRNLALILSNPVLITQSDYIETYNCVYKHCNKQTSTYIIQGEEIYNLISAAIEEFSEKLRFNGSIKAITEQIHTFNATIALLEMIFSYLERFYIKVSTINLKEVKQLKDLFFFKIYYNFVFKIEEVLLDLIFLEIETLRKIYRRDFADLKLVIEFYIKCLENNDLKGRIKQFYKRYVQEFRTKFDFDIEIGKLLKRVYIEMFFATTAINDRDVSREIIQSIMLRKDEILQYVFLKLKMFDKIKHMYVIINMMPENCKLSFKKRYEEHLKEHLKETSGFDMFFSSYCKFKDHVETNKLASFDELIDFYFRRSFFEKSVQEQVEIHQRIVSVLDDILTNDKSLLDNKAYFNFIPYISKGIVEEDKKKNATSTQCCKIDTIFDLFSLVNDDYLIELFTKSIQLRLLKGASPEREYKVVEMILIRVGLGVANIMKNSVQSFLSRDRLFLDGVSISCARITKGFWGLEKTELELHPSLEDLHQKIVQSVNIPDRHILAFNYNLSPAIFELNNTKYKINSDTLSLLLFIQDNAGIDIETLRKKVKDRNFDSGMSLLINNEFVATKIDDSGAMCLYVLNKQSAMPFVDLFEIKDVKSTNQVALSADTECIQILEAKICKLLKKIKEAQASVLREQTSSESFEFDTAVANLVSKGYLEVYGDYLKYVP